MTSTGPSRRTALVTAAVAVLAVILVVVGRSVIAQHGRDDTGRPSRVATHTTPIVRQTLADTRTTTGTIGFVRPRPLTGAGTGVVTALPTVGATTKRGATLYRVDDQPVPVFYGRTPMFRAIDKVGVTGSDVYVLADNLHRLGYFNGYLPDDPHAMVFSSLLRTDLKAWQRDIGAAVTGSLRPGQVVVLPGLLRVGSVTAALGAPAAGQLGTLTEVGKIITGRATTGITSGKADLVLADGTKITGRISVSDRGEQPTFTARPDHPAALDGVERGKVTVTVTVEIHRNVLAVPITALLALQGGRQYAVQRPDGQLVAVRTGMFTSDMVEISGTGLRSGQPVVTAA